MGNIEREDGQLEPVHQSTDGPAMSTLQLTGGTSPGHAERMLRALGHDPRDAT